VEHQEKGIFPNPIEEWDGDKSFMIKLLDVILDTLGWIRDKYPLDVKALREIREIFYEEKSCGS